MTYASHAEDLGASGSAGGKRAVASTTKRLRRSLIRGRRVGFLAKVTRGAELSVGYTFFWAAFEKANAFLELAIRTRRQPLTSYAMRRVYEEGLPEGGSWSLYQQVHLKYGAVPATAYVDTVGAASGDLLQLLDWELRRFAVQDGRK